MGNYAIKFLFVLTVTLSISCASSHKIDENALALSDKKASTETVELYLKLQENLERGTMLGHQDALAYGNNWFLDEGRSDVKSVCGDYPAVFGWDIGDIEKGNLANCDSIPFTTLANYVRKVEQWAVYRYSLGMRATPSQGKPPVIAVHKTRSNRLSKMIRFKRNFLLRWTRLPSFWAT